jgi:ribosomal protein S13
MVFVKAQVGPPNCGEPDDMFTVQYFDEQGNMRIRGGGTRAWRCNNPGNLLASRYSTGVKRRSIGTAGDGKNEYAVYPDYETGHEALVVMLKGGVYSSLTLREAMKRYDSTNPHYIDTIVSKTGFDSERKVKSLNDKEFEKFWWAIEDTEKWKVGKEDFIPKCYITGVRLKRGVIDEYRIHQNGKDVWLSKQEAIALAQEWKLHAILVHSSNGRLYLRPEYHGKPFHQMAC